MELTKEECRFALKSFEPRTAKEHFKGGYYSFVKAYGILENLINEYFELVEEHKKLKRMLKTFK